MKTISPHGTMWMLEPLMHVLLFVKYPEPGTVKTRLAASLGPEHAAGLYNAFVQDTLVMLQGLRARVTMYCAPEYDEARYRGWLPDRAFKFQRGAHLGERMQNALAESLTESERVLLIGSDLPDLPGSHLLQGWEALRYKPLCFGKAADGGFYLVGSTRDGLHPELFRDVSWSTSRVLRQTLANCQHLGIATHSLPVWPDIDTVKDLRALEARGTPAAHSRTYIHAHELELRWND